MWQGQKILVTGAAGFLGSHLVKSLLKQGASRVIGLDNLQTGRIENIADCRRDARFSWIEHDITQPFRTEEKLDTILNFACPASPVHYQADPIRTMKTNWLGALHMLELAELQHARLVQASTSEVYGDPLVHPQPESYWGHVNPIGPRSCYDEGKRAAETLCYDYAQKRQVDVGLVRIFNTYGPQMAPDDGRVVSNFIVQALREEPISIYGDGSQTRSFCYVDDLVRGILAFTQKTGVFGPINLGNDSEFSVKNLAEEVLRLTKSKSQITFHPLPKDDPKQRKPDLRQAKALIDYAPQVALREGLSLTIPYFRARGI